MAFGPLELMVLSFPTDRLNDGVRTTLDRLASAGEMRVVDVLVVRTDAAGGACAVELTEIPGLRGDRTRLARLATGLITESDIDEMAPMVDNETDALAVLLEHRWVRDLAGPIAASRGSIVALTHISGAPGHGRVLTGTTI
ncbi:hypothetical protein FB565_001009 [Actinoplanes lutulentus]|uniref:Uncharacterized protein n=1 Tax=Actinoplanes lutulentus TaxID=1287878 RepID=A0A327ZAT8_9ACTN|nr:DUF6325 family protein [Actinoplanes lutulentus]MBB2941305.1 hypothetical protein [Actinoplanes lutulentus]RAK36797.1 hypothetical protein B0I29_10759 [Actinoplanes lutulentus]